MQVEVTIGVQQPKSRRAAVKASLPRGQVTVKVVKGGLDVPAEGDHDLAVIASAAIAVRFDLPYAIPDDRRHFDRSSDSRSHPSRSRGTRRACARNRAEHRRAVDCRAQQSSSRAITLRPTINRSQLC